MPNLQGLKLHVVSFDVPYPADYGGVIDVFYKIKSLFEAGCKIYLHCFQYGRNSIEELANYCEEVWYYPRLTGLRGLSFQHPYIISSRKNRDLLQRLINIEAPILFEGVHSTYYAKEAALRQRTKILRTHNVEFQYYHQLSRRSKNLFSKLYFKAESILLKSFEPSLQMVDAIFCLSQEDVKTYRKMYADKIVDFIAPFHPFETSDVPLGSGHYCLYHGNLSHPENEEAAIFLLKTIIPRMKHVDFIIAGKNPSKLLTSAIASNANCTLITNPGEAEMNRLIREAHINLLPTFQRSGMKLKLLYALFNGKHIIANKNMLWGTGLYDTCIIADTAVDIQKAIEATIHKAFTEDMRNDRVNALDLHYNNKINALKFTTFLQQRSL